MPNLRANRLSVLFLAALIQLWPQTAQMQIRDPWNDIQHRQPMGVLGPLDDAGIRDVTINQTSLVTNDQVTDHPISGTVSVRRLRHQVPTKARNELARAERELRQGRLQ